MDRSAQTSTKSSGGVVLIAVSSEIKSKVIPTSNSDIECVFISVKLYPESLRQRCEELSGSCYMGYLDHVEIVLPENPRVRWSLIKNLNRSCSIVSTIAYNRNTTDDPKNV
ncbi:hypothetical protein J6590_017571 [Homalodisca vitripennis]|nr:hypothetical protein J6590_017571 [Homalodisca vitripennis]